jgi:hypothetical protein
MVCVREGGDVFVVVWVAEGWTWEWGGGDRREECVVRKDGLLAPTSPRVAGSAAIATIRPVVSRANRPASWRPTATSDFAR